MYKRKLVAVLMATMMVATAFTGCGKKQETATTKTSDVKETSAEKESSSETPKEKQKLTVWSHLRTAEVEALGKIADEWGAANNCTVEVIEDQSGMQAFQEAANSPSGPDIMYGIPHDNLGTFNKAGLLAEVPAGTIDVNNYISKNVIDAITIGGKQIAMPISVEAIGMFYNKDLVSEVPATMEEVVEIGKEKGFQFNVTDFYLVYPFLAANGGYVFKNNNGTLDVTDIGINNEGSVKGYQFIQDLVSKDKLMPPDINDGIAKGNFKDKKTAFYISGPWNVKDIKDSGVNYGLATLPTLNGKVTTPFMGVQTAFVSNSSKNQDLAWQLITYLNENAAEALMITGNRIPVLKSAQESETFKSNTDMQVFAKSAEFAVPMPNVPEVSTLWTPSASNLKNMIIGKLTPKEAADNTVAMIKEGIAQIK